MEELRCYLDLAEETRRADRRRKVLGKHLDGYLPVVLQIPCEIDCGHRATAYLAFDGVASAESGAHSLKKAGSARGFGCVRAYAQNYWRYAPVSQQPTSGQYP